MAKVKLNELANIYLGVTHTPEYVFEGVPFLSVKDISGGKICFDDCKYISKEEYDSLSEGAKPKVGDMLFCRVGTLGKPIIIPEGTPLFGTFVSLGYLRNRNSDRCDLNYLKYWMYSNSFWKQVNANVKGASQVNLNTGWLSKFDIDLPGIAEQRYRISVLDKCKSVIEKREAELAALDNLIKARFVEMFGTLDTPTQAFEKATLKELCNKITDGKHGGCKSEVGTERYFVGAREIYDDDVHYELAPEINIEEFEKDYKRCNVEIGDFLIVNTGATIGKSAIACDKRTEHTLLQKSVALLKVKKDVLNPIFLKWCYRVNTKMYMVENASAQPNLLLSKINATVIYVPDIELQNQFADFVHQVDKSKVAVQKALDETQMLFDSLMQEYFG